MTPGWTSRSDDNEATLAAARRWARRRRTRSDLADVKRACIGLASVLTALGGVIEDAQKGSDRYWGGGLQIDDQPSLMDWREDRDRGDAALAAIREHLNIALNLMTQAASETAAAAEQVGHLSSPINNDDLAERYVLVDELTAGMTPPRRLNIVPPPEDVS